MLINKGIRCMKDIINYLMTLSLLMLLSPLFLIIIVVDLIFGNDC